MTMRMPGERVSIAVLEGGYACQDRQRGQFAWGRVLESFRPHKPGDHSIVLIALDGGQVTWREACYVHDEWYYYNEVDWKAARARFYARILRGDEEEGDAGDTNDGQ